MLDVDFNQIINMIEKRKNNAYKKVNEEMILLYLEVGKFLYDLKQNSNYGDKITTKAADFMKNNYPTIKGFTKRNIERMIQFYTTYKDDEIATPLVTQLSWTNNLLVLSGSKTKEERIFYLKLSIKHNYSKRELDRQISSSYYQRYMLSNGNASKSVTKIISGEDDFPHTRILDTYSLEFLDLPNEFTEKDLKISIIKNLKDFILEIGKDFTFIGDEYRVQVGNHDYFIDLLFYNRELSCLVAFELKLGEFMPEYLGKMNLYLEALDRDVKKSNENPSVGIILCSSKDKDVAEYSINKNMSQTLISEYKLKLIDKKLLEAKLREMKSLIKKETK
jgi:predicted nuclease of restriction endonuclease-like (RecB) superfamily